MGERGGLPRRNTRISFTNLSIFAWIAAEEAETATYPLARALLPRLGLATTLWSLPKQRRMPFPECFRSQPRKRYSQRGRKASPSVALLV